MLVEQAKKNLHLDDEEIIAVVKGHYQSKRDGELLIATPEKVIVYSQWYTGGLFAEYILHYKYFDIMYGDISSVETGYVDWVGSHTIRIYKKKDREEIIFEDEEGEIKKFVTYVRQQARKAENEKRNIKSLLQCLTQLKLAGILSDEEYEIKKNKVLKTAKD